MQAIERQPRNCSLYLRAPAADEVAMSSHENQTDGANGPQVVISARTLADAVYVIAVNAGDRATDATISLPALDGRTLTVLGESRRVDSDGGSFTDHFVPLDVHIYVAAANR
jgi:hypothetical protein